MTSARLVVDQHQVSKDEGIALLSLMSDAGELSRLDLQFSQLSGLRSTNPAALDFLLLAVAVYGLDKLVGRETALDGWTRTFELGVPVSDPQTWNAAAKTFSKALTFLSGDHWVTSFSARKAEVIRPQRRRRRRTRRIVPPAPRAHCACLFSGGLDSLVGVIDLLESQPSNVMLIGHHDGQMAGPLSDQNALLTRLSQHYPRRLHPILARVGHSNEAADITLRCRSLLFIALGIYGASALGEQVPLFIPENGTIALNVPLTPSRRGSCSTRTTHQAFLEDLQLFLGAIGMRNPIISMLHMKTKGEVVAECKNPAILHQLAPLSVSCAKRGHKRTWVNRNAKSCGRCMPCIYRRAALHKVGWDTESYGSDICRGEVNVDDRGQAADDLRACLAFLRSSPNSRQLQTALLANGSLDITRLSAYADVVLRAMDEIRALISAKGTARIRQLAGV